MSSFDGKWKVTVMSPMGQQELTVTLATEGETVSGSLEGAMGSTTFADGKVDGEGFAFDTTITEPFNLNITVTGTADGDELKGQVKTQGFGAFPMKGVRV